MKVGCSNPDETLTIHDESETCANCAATPPEPRRIGGRTREEWRRLWDRRVQGANGPSFGRLFGDLLSAAFSEPSR